MGSTRLSLYLRVQFLYITLANQEIEETCDNIMLFHFILFFLFMYLHFIVSYYVMVQVCSAAVESG